MEEMTANSISVSIEKGSVDEELSLCRASMEDAESRLADGMKPVAISNEKIQKGVYNPYEVTILVLVEYSLQFPYG